MNKFHWLLIPLLLIWILYGAWYMSHSPCVAAAKEQKTAVTASVAPTPPPAKKILWSASDGPFKASSTERFTFPQSNFAATVPAPTQTAFQSIASYLKSKPNRQLVLTGRYDATENNTSSFANLGVARAEDIKKRLVNMGATADNILTNGLEETGITFDNNLLLNGVNFAFRGKSADELETLARKLKAKPLNVYFATGKSQILFDDNLRQYFQDLKYYTDNTPSAAISVTGHTDNVGNPVSNTALGRKRAIFIQEYMTRQGFKTNQIQADSKGPNAPIADNATDAGLSLIHI